MMHLHHANDANASLPNRRGRPYLEVRIDQRMHRRQEDL